jgi:hypothetical protein
MGAGGTPEYNLSARPARIEGARRTRTAVVAVAAVRLDRSRRHLNPSQGVLFVEGFAEISTYICIGAQSP